MEMYIHVIYVTWAGGICLIYMQEPKGTEGKCGHVRKILTAHVKYVMYVTLLAL